MMTSMDRSTYEFVRTPVLFDAGRTDEWKDLVLFITCWACKAAYSLQPNTDGILFTSTDFCKFCESPHNFRRTS
jgi:hypothetical protein